MGAWLAGGPRMGPGAAGSRVSEGVRAYSEAGLEPQPLAFASREVDGVLIMDLFDFIGEDWFGEGISSRAFSERLARSDAKTVILRINSPGGFAFEGHAIRSLVRSHAEDRGARIEVEVHGLCASAATTIAMAGDEVRIAEDAMFMIHEAWNIEIGEADDMRHQADLLDKFNEQMARLYVKRTGKSTAKIREMMKAETWMSGAEAVKEGFADSVIPSSGEADAEASNERAFATLSQFAHAPVEVLDRYRSQRGERLAAAMSSKPATAAQPTPTTRDDDMNREALCALLNLPTSTSDADLKAAVSNGAQAVTLLVEARADLKTSEAKVTALEDDKTLQDIEHRLALACTTGHDGKGPRLTRPAADAAKAKLTARAKKGGLALETVLEDLTEIEARPPVSVAGPARVREDAAARDAVTDETGLTKAELEYCARHGKDPKQVAKDKAAAKGLGSGRMATTTDDLDAIEDGE